MDENKQQEKSKETQQEDTPKESLMRADENKKQRKIQVPQSSGTMMNTKDKYDILDKIPDQKAGT